MAAVTPNGTRPYATRQGQADELRAVHSSNSRNNINPAAEADALHNEIARGARTKEH